MIVRDEEKRLARCLDSAKGLFDEVVIADTGSRDATNDVAHPAGASVYEVGWSDDFSIARNAVQSYCTGAYVFWMDADEVIPKRTRAGLAPH